MKEQNEKPPAPHGFSCVVANLENDNGERLGATPAIILRYLANRIRQRGAKIHEGKRWWRVKLDHILKQYPYLGRTTVDENIKKLERFGICEVQNLNQVYGRPKFDRTRWFHVPKEFTDMAEKELRYFDPTLAEKIGVVAAVVYYNFLKRLESVRQKLELDAVGLSPTDLSSRLPYDRSTCKRAIKSLTNEKLIVPVPGHPGFYSDKLLNADGSYPNEDGANPDENGSNPDETGSNPDNNIVIRIDKECSKENSKGKPAACLEIEPEKRNPSADQQFPETGTCSIAVDIDHSANSPSTAKQVSELPETSSEQSNPETYYFSKSALLIKNFHDLQLGMDEFSRQLAEHNEKVQNSCVIHLLNSAQLFFRSQGESSILAWLRCTNVDQLYSAIAPRFWPYCPQAIPSNRSLGKEGELWIIALFHFIMAGFLQEKGDSGIRRYPNVHLLRRANELNRDILKVKMDHDERVHAETVASRKKEFASVDEAKELSEDLSPAEKTRIFKNGINSRNKVGWTHYTRKFLTDQITVTKGGLNEIERLFELNPKLTARELLKIMDGCMEFCMDSSAPPEEYEGGIRWHARHGGKDIWKFARFLKAIVKDLEYECNITFLGDAEEVNSRTASAFVND